MPQRSEISNKGSFGKVLNISGSDYMPTAALLSSTSALKIGCGYVILCSTDRVINAVASQSQNIVFAPLNSMVENINQADVVLIGCGLSLSDTAFEIFNKALDNIKNIPTIIDADGLNILTKLNDIKLPDNLILTPHPKEASRLLGCNVDEILNDMKNSSREISKKYNCVTVLKSHNTVVCDKNFDIYINHTGGSELAKAGTGDVLSGMIAGLVAQKMTLFEASKLAVYLLGIAGNFAQKELTKYSVLPFDVINHIPQAIKTIV